MEMRKAITVSPKLLLVYFFSIAYLFIFNRIFLFSDHTVAIKLIRLGGTLQLINTKYAYFNFINYFALIAGYIQFMLFIGMLAILKIDSDELPCENNIITESVLIGLSFVNITTVLLKGLSLNFIFLPSEMIFIGVLITSFVFSFFLSYTEKKNFQSRPEEDITISIKTKLDNAFLKFGFPNPKLVFLVSYTLALLIIISSHSLYSTSGQHINSTAGYISLVLGLVGTGYLLLARHYKMRKMDELKRLILLEQANTSFAFIVFAFITCILLYFCFNIKILVFDLAIVVGPMFAFSFLLAQTKYK